MSISAFQVASSAALGCKKMSISLIPGTFSVGMLSKGDLGMSVNYIFHSFDK